MEGSEGRKQKGEEDDDDDDYDERKSRAAAVARTAALRYDMKKRDPLYARADTSCWWELACAGAEPPSFGRGDGALASVRHERRVHR